MDILLVEDDEIVGDAVRTGLVHAGYRVDWVTDGRAAEHALNAQRYALLLLDLNLPQRHGLDVLRSVRAADNPVPVLILTARDTVTDRVRGLDAGADDYLVKPFELDELYARVRALLRRSDAGATQALRHGDIVLDPGTHTVTSGGAPVELTRREFALLKLLLESAGRVVSRTRLEEELYGWETDVESNTVEVHIHHLRRKLGADLIHTLRGIGYLIRRPDA